jgi:CDP-diacylglycerol--glycerol-3-phosphate 3-phosphatidyltransferase
MNLANQLTMLRFVLALATFAALSQDASAAHLLALALFLAAIVTDWIDGYVARRMKMISPFGKVADPIADKVLILGTLIALTKTKELDIPLWGVFLIFAREVIIGGIRTLSMIQQGKLLAAETWGKWKMGVQSVCVALMLLILVAREQFGAAPAWLERIPYPLTVLSVIVTWVSAILYFRQSRKMLQNSWN